MNDTLTSSIWNLIFNQLRYKGAARAERIADRLGPIYAKAVEKAIEQSGYIPQRVDTEWSSADDVNFYLDVFCQQIKPSDEVLALCGDMLANDHSGAVIRLEGDLRKVKITHVRRFVKSGSIIKFIDDRAPDDE